jgi:hypothetical protein
MDAGHGRSTGYGSEGLGNKLAYPIFHSLQHAGAGAEYGPQGQKVSYLDE